jgi:hypothetical protein
VKTKETPFLCADWKLNWSILPNLKNNPSILRFQFLVGQLTIDRRRLLRLGDTINFFRYSSSVKSNCSLFFLSHASKSSVYATAVHHGEQVHNSHIFSYIRSPDDPWYQANNASITQMNRDRVLSDKDAYILCYTKAPEDATTSTETIARISLSKTSKQLAIKHSSVREHLLTFDYILIFLFALCSDEFHGESIYCCR